VLTFSRKVDECKPLGGGQGLTALGHPVLRAAAWYAGKVRGAFPVVVLSDQSEGAAGPLPPGVVILPAAAYFPRFYADNPAALEMYESLRAAQEDAAAAAASAATAASGAAEADTDGGGGGAGGAATLFAPHLAPVALAEGRGLHSSTFQLNLKRS